MSAPSSAKLSSFPEYIAPMSSVQFNRINSHFPPLNPNKHYKGVYERCGFEVYKPPANQSSESQKSATGSVSGFSPPPAPRGLKRPSLPELKNRVTPPPALKSSDRSGSTGSLPQLPSQQQQPASPVLRSEASNFSMSKSQLPSPNISSSMPSQLSHALQLNQQNQQNQATSQNLSQPMSPNPMSPNPMSPNPMSPNLSQAMSPNNVGSPSSSRSSLRSVFFRPFRRDKSKLVSRKGDTAMGSPSLDSSSLVSPSIVSPSLASPSLVSPSFANSPLNSPSLVENSSANTIASSFQQRQMQEFANPFNGHMDAFSSPTSEGVPDKLPTTSAYTTSTAFTSSDNSVSPTLENRPISLGSDHDLVFGPDSKRDSVGSSIYSGIVHDPTFSDNASDSKSLFNDIQQNDTSVKEISKINTDPLMSQSQNSLASSTPSAMFSAVEHGELSQQKMANSRSSTNTLESVDSNDSIIGKNMDPATPVGSEFKLARQSVVSEVSNSESVSVKELKEEPTLPTIEFDNDDMEIPPRAIPSNSLNSISNQRLQYFNRNPQISPPIANKPMEPSAQAPLKVEERKPLATAPRENYTPTAPLAAESYSQAPAAQNYSQAPIAKSYSQTPAAIVSNSNNSTIRAAPVSALLSTSISANPQAQPQTESKPLEPIANRIQVGRVELKDISDLKVNTTPKIGANTSGASPATSYGFSPVARSPTSFISQVSEDPELKVEPEEEYTKYPSGEGPCRKCGLDIAGKSIWSKDHQMSGRWHRACFSCYRCDDTFTKGTNCYVINDKPYCNYDFHYLNHSLCRICDSGIEGKCLENNNGERFHPDCLKCVKCGVGIVKDYFVLDGKPLCENDGLRAIEMEQNSLRVLSESDENGGLKVTSKVEKRRTFMLELPENKPFGD